MSKKVLIIDDEEIIRKYLGINLVKWGFEVKEAADEKQAIKQLKEDDFDLLIWDILMPNKDGWEVLKEVRSNSKTKETPVIVLTVKNEDADIFKVYELGASYYITKPFTKAQLLSGIQLIFKRDSESFPVGRQG